MDVSTARKNRALDLAPILTAVALAAGSGCSTYIGTTPKSFLKHVESDPDPNIRYIAYSKLGHRDLYEDAADLDGAVKTLVKKLDEGREPVAIRAVIIRTLGELGDRRARNAISRVANNPNAEAMLKVEAYRALGKVGTPEDAMTLARIMNTDPLEDSRIAAIEGIGALKAQDPRIYHVLIEGMENEDPAIRLESYRSLKKITGKDHGNLPKDWRLALEPKASTKDGAPAAAATATATATATGPVAEGPPALQR
jgi:HEAT repeat protein